MIIDIPELHQWDVKKQITVDSTATWVDYDIQGIAGCIRVPVTGGRAYIPNIVLTRWGQLNVTVVRYNEQSGERWTIGKASTNVIRKEKDPDYVYSDEDYINWSWIRNHAVAEAQAVIDSAVEQIEVSRDAAIAEIGIFAGEKKDEVSQLANAAAQSAITAGNHSMDSKESAEIAKRNANDALRYRNEAQNFFNGAGTAYEEAEAAAGRAEQAAAGMDTAIDTALEPIRNQLSYKMEKVHFYQGIVQNGMMVGLTDEVQGKLGSIAQKQDKLIAGSGITIGKDGRTISANGGGGGGGEKLTFTGAVSAEYDGSQPVTVNIPSGGGDVPEHLPNPYKLTLTGAVSASYDGSKAVTVEIPMGGDGGGITRTRYAYNNMLNPAYETGWVVVSGNAYNSGVVTNKQSYIYVRTLPFPLAGGSTVKITGRRKWDVATHSLVNGYPNPGTTSRMHCFDADGNFLGSVTNKTVDGTAYVYEALPDTATATFTYYFGNNLKDEPSWIDAISAVFGEWYLGIDYEIYENQSKIPRYDKYEEVAPRYVNRILGDIDAFRGRTVAVIGDSIDTYPGRNAVEITITEEDVGVELRAYPTVHDVGNTYGSVTVASDMIGTEITFTPTADDVGKEIGVPLNHATKTRKTWWQNLEQELGVNVNAVAWSGAAISSRVSDTEHAISHAWHEATIRKCGTRIPGSMRRIAPDYIFIDRGINDYEYNYTGKVYGLNYETGITTIPETDIVDGVRAYDVALLMTINKLRTAYPLATIIVCTTKEATRGTAVGNITYTNGGKTIAQIAEMQKRVATLTQCQVCDFHSAIPLRMVYHMSADGTHLSNTGHYMCYLEAVKCLMDNPKPAWFDRDRWDTSNFYYNP